MIEQRSPEWFAARKGKITGSKVGAILGLSQYQTQEDVLRAMAREYHGAPSEFEGNIFTEWGNANEAGATLDYELDTGNSVAPASFVEYAPWLGASPDGYVGERGLIEIKCPYSKRDAVCESEFKPISDQPYYYAQIQIQLLATGRDWCDFYQWAPLAQKLERVDFDFEWVAVAVKTLHAFHVRFLAEVDNPKHLAPPVKFPSKPTPVEMLESQAAGDFECMARQYKSIADEVKSSQAKMKALLEKMATDYGECKIGGFKLSKVKRAGSISYATIVKEHLPDLDLDQYRGAPSESWSLK